MGHKSSSKKRKKSDPKNKSNRKQDLKKKKKNKQASGADTDHGSGVPICLSSSQGENSEQVVRDESNEKS